jgi:hypothetical protein
MATRQVGDAIRVMDDVNMLPGAMVMLGEGAFTLTDHDGVEHLLKELRPLGGTLLVSRLAEVVPCV